MITRRGFLAAAAASAAAGVGSKGALGATAANGASHDPNLMVLLADIHMLDNSVRWPNGPTHQNALLQKFVKEILAMRPLPAHAVVFGDFSASSGWEEDFAMAAKFLRPLAEAGIKLTLGMGNHDNRKNFLKTFPGYRKRMLLEDRIVSMASTPYADLIMLDTLKTRDGDGWGEPTTSGNCVEGALDAAQRAWLRKTLASATRPVFIGSHHLASEVGMIPELVNGKTVYGHILGHRHAFEENFLHDGYSNSQTVQTVTLPSAGYWGDIGYALFRTFPDRAELTVRQTDFFFNREWADRPRPKNWLERARRHDGTKVTFWYDKPGNFWKA